MVDLEIKRLLFRIAHENDKSAFTRFFKLYHARLMRFALIYICSYQDAEDLVTDVMIKILRHRKKLFEIENFEGYLFRSIKNQAINFIKKNKRRDHILLSDIPKDYLTNHFVQPFETVLENELQEIIVKIVQELPPQRKTVFQMIKDDGMKIKEVAEILEITEKTVKKHLELALKDLRLAIDNYYDEISCESFKLRIS